MGWSGAQARKAGKEGKKGKQEERKGEVKEGEEVANTGRERKRKKGCESERRFTRADAYVSTYADKNVLIWGTLACEPPRTIAKHLRRNGAQCRDFSPFFRPIDVFFPLRYQRLAVCAVQLAFHRKFETEIKKFESRNRASMNLWTRRSIDKSLFLFYRKRESFNALISN